MIDFDAFQVKEPRMICIDEFIAGRAAIQCLTLNDAISFLQECESAGIAWCYAAKISVVLNSFETRWCGPDSCFYRCNRGEIHNEPISRFGFRSNNNFFFNNKPVLITYNDNQMNVSFDEEDYLSLID
jgi:hypothetical protein